ncbi:MAG: hypothetical protein ACREPQ_14560 [Rhodanobacter sp.]
MFAVAEIENALTARHTYCKATLGIRQSFYRFLRTTQEMRGEAEAIVAAEACVDGNGPFGHSDAARECAQQYLA